MRKIAFVVSGFLLVLMTVLLCVGYAALTDSLLATGSASMEVLRDGIVITDVKVVSGTTATDGLADAVYPTNLKSKLTGSAGQKVVYAITVRNYSLTDTYVYMGVDGSDQYAATMSKLSVKASADASGAKPLPNNTAATYAEGTPIAPGQEYTFYVTYTLGGALSNADLLLHYAFSKVVYTVTYMSGNEIYAVDCIVDNSKPYTVRSYGPDNGGQRFADWVNANAVGVDSYPAYNTNSYTLSAKWENVYLIIFVDEKGNVLYEETFTDTTKKYGLTTAGQAETNAILEELRRADGLDDMSVSWSSYDLKNATSDITVRPVYTYTGNLRYTPVDENKDGITDYYQVDAVDALDEHTKIRGSFMGLDVRVVNKLYKNDDNYDYGSGVKIIEIGEGVRTLNHNSLAYTSSLQTVKLPHTLERIEKNAFSRNSGSDRKVLRIEFNGTMAEWAAVSKDGDWHNGLQTGSRVVCSDGYYELTFRGIFGLGTYTWKSYPN